MNLLLPRRLSALAREHALGQLRGGARRQFERLLATSDAAQRELARWQGEFATLAAAVPPLAPREAVWRGLQQRLGLRPAPESAPPWWQRILAPKVLGGALAGVMVGLVSSTLLLQQNPEWIGHELRRDGLPASYVGLLSDAAGKPAVLLSSRRHGRVLTVKMLQPLVVPAGQVARLWAFPKPDANGNAAPFLVGTPPASGSGTIALPESSEKLFFKVDRLGISLEPASPDQPAPPAAPTTPLVLAGPCVKLW